VFPQLAEVQAEAEADKRALENKVDELTASYEALQDEHKEVQVEKGLLLGANRNLKERVEALGVALEENKKAMERRKAEVAAQMEAEVEAVRTSAAASQASLEGRIKELQRSQSEAAARQVRNNRIKCNTKY
jgi:Sec-independent protein translocase protein TatA